MSTPTPSVQPLHAFRDDALGDHDAVGLVAELHAGRVSVPEVVEAAIARTEAVAGELNAVAHAAYDSARARARDPRGGFFSGVPTFVKDNADVAGMPSQHGSDAFVAPIAPRDGDFARMYLATGLVPLGKTQMSEFGFSAAAEHPRLGPVRNPWDRDRTAGASSSGAGALVAAGAVPLAHANDGGGSIRIPAAVNGLVGLKPTRGRVPTDALNRQMPVRIVADGVVTRSVRDTAAFLRECERVYRPRGLRPVGDVTTPLDPRRDRGDRLRVALVVRGIGHDATPEVAEATRATGRLLEELGHEVVELDRPPVPAWFVDDFLTYWGFLAGAILASGRATHGATWDRMRTDNLTRGLDRRTRRRAYRLPLAMSRLQASGVVSGRFFRDHDLVLTPTLATPTPRVGHLDPTQDFEVVLERLLAWVAFTPLQNATGEPSLSLPLATDSDGLPLGMCLSAPRGYEDRLLGLALALEQAAPWPRADRP